MNGLTRPLVIATTALMISAPAIAQALPDITGSLNPRLTAVTQSYASVEFAAAKNVMLPGVDAGAAASTATIRLIVNSKGEPLTVAFVDHGDRSAIYIDANFNGRFDAAERIVLTPSQRTSTHDHVVDLHLPFAGSPVAPLHFDVVFAMKRSPATLRYNAQFRAEGYAEIDGQRTLVSLPFDLANGRANTRAGFIGVDTNGDGSVVINGLAGPELVWAGAEAPVIHVRNAYVHVDSADFASHSFTLKQHPAAEFTFEETTVGKPMFDFAFTDTHGAAHKISDYRGKLLLLDFWGTWCAPCLADIPEIKSMYETYHDKGLEIIGVDYEPKLNMETVRAVNARYAVPWILTDPASVTNTIHVLLRVEAFPTYVLIGRDGVVLAMKRGGPLKDIVAAIEKAQQ